jgi:hypothetical protein
MKVLQPAQLSTSRIIIQEQIEGRPEFPTDEWLATRMLLGDVSEILEIWTGGILFRSAGSVCNYFYSKRRSIQ